MQNPIQKFGLSSIVLEKSCTLSENLKTLTLPYSSTVFAETSYTFPTIPMSTKGSAGFFKILFRS